jgi:hypothetical protein
VHHRSVIFALSDVFSARDIGLLHLNVILYDDPKAGDLWRVSTRHPASRA